MNFYFNYFSSIGRESKLIVNCQLSTLLCLFLKKVDSF